MNEISVTGSDLNIMCRLCLSSGVTLLDIFRFSSKMKNSVAGVIMKYAAVQIIRGDKMPNFICQSCYTQLEKTRQFVIQIEQSDRTLRRYLQLLYYDSDKPIKAEDTSILNTNNDIVTCETLKLNDVFEMELDRKETEPENFNQENKKEISLKSEIKHEKMDDNLLMLTESVDDTENASSNGDINEISFEDTNVTEHFRKCEETIKRKKRNKSINCQKHKKSNKLKSYQCDICNKCFARKFNLNRHNLIHTGEKPYQCDLCNKCFSQSSDLNRHKLKHTGEKHYQCNLCKKSFSQLSSLNSHKLKHTGEKPYQCDLCKKRFSWSSNLIIHKRKHTGEKPHQCDVCGKCFSQPSQLNAHKLKHTGEKPYQCDLCKKCFSQLSSLNSHKLKHTGEKPYQCDLCNKCFSKSSHYRHKHIHTVGKPFQCDVCNKCFTQLSKLNKHKFAHS